MQDGKGFFKFVEIGYISYILKEYYKYAPISFLSVNSETRFCWMEELADVRVWIPGEIIDFCRRRIKGQAAL